MWRYFLSMFKFIIVHLSFRYNEISTINKQRSSILLEYSCLRNCPCNHNIKFIMALPSKFLHPNALNI